MKIRYQHEHLPDGMEVSLTGLNAVLKNNTDVEVDDGIMEEFAQRMDKSVDEVLKGKEFGGSGRPKPEKENDEPIEHHFWDREKGEVEE